MQLSTSARTRALAASAYPPLDFGTGVPLSAAAPLVSLGPQDLHDSDTARFRIASTSDSYQVLSAGNSPLKATSAHGIQHTEHMLVLVYVSTPAQSVPEPDMQDLHPSWGILSADQTQH